MKFRVFFTCSHRPAELVVLFYVRAIAPYSGAAGQLTFNFGDVMGVTEEMGAWYTASLSAVSGLVPCNHVEVCFFLGVICGLLFFYMTGRYGIDALFTPWSTR